MQIYNSKNKKDLEKICNKENISYMVFQFFFSYIIQLQVRALTIRLAWANTVVSIYRCLWYHHNNNPVYQEAQLVANSVTSAVPLNLPWFSLNEIIIKY